MFSFSPMSSWTSAKELRAWRRHVSNFTLLNFGQKMGIRVKGQTFYVYMTLLLSSPSKNWLVLVANHMARIFYGFFKGSSEDPPPHNQVYLFWLHSTSHLSPLLLLSLPAEFQQDGWSLANSPVPPWSTRNHAFLAFSYSYFILISFFPTEIDSKGNQPACCKGNQPACWKWDASLSFF